MQKEIEAVLKEMGLIDLSDIPYFVKYYELAVSGLTLDEIIREENQDALMEVIQVFNEEREKIITHFVVENIRKYRKALGIEYDEMKGRIKQRYGVQKTGELSPHQWQEIETNLIWDYENVEF
ncbi:hypothetical protein H1P_6630002 [Hyella patelloides LEGE 07179]|uniref:Uncharacterized protein n=1 Tax=Hyella patelloides LEGE 07179 TaxID=945734 RepID=A0A563W2P6_9CYAN|nr:hypothetical protein [Hyella patelloides]VEP17961.1 hypothetical protein H1P_6630002 [Hyella patelloides LEGE 07179]